jgi:glycosyltransferase involved in cell wall biosynthesis
MRHNAACGLFTKPSTFKAFCTGYDIMRVLWFIIGYSYMPEYVRHIGQEPSVKGGWMFSLLDALRRTDDALQFGVAFPGGSKSLRHEVIHGAHYYDIPLQYPGESESCPSPETIKICRNIVDDFRPDVVHIHGTEHYFGLLFAHGHFRTPAVISIQGLIHVSERYYFGGLSLSELIRAHTVSDMVFRCGLIHEKLRWKKRARIEREIIAGNRHFIGRTLWDRAHVRDVNPSATYSHCDELLRPPFYSARWRYETCRKFTIFTPTGVYPLKGLHWLLKAAAILKREFPTLKVRIADGLFAHGLAGKTLFQKMKMRGYSYYLARLVDDLELHDTIELTGQLSAEQMAAELEMAHVFVTPSMVENSCNALSEALLIGTPCVVSLAGGMTSMIEDRRTALGFPPGDEAVLAEAVRMIFTDNALAGNLSQAAREAAHRRHSEVLITRRMLEIYSRAIG